MGFRKRRGRRPFLLPTGPSVAAPSNSVAGLARLTSHCSRQRSAALHAAAEFRR